jgi:hypothetical protein
VQDNLIKKGIEAGHDYSQYVICANKIIRGIGENANEGNYKKAFELAYHLETLSVMLKESLVKK